MSNNHLVPSKVFFTKGVGIHKEKLTSFELALRSAGIEKFNLVTVSSIFPPRCKAVSKEIGLSYMHAGQVVFCVMSRDATNEPHRLVSASVGCAIPQDRSTYGYLSEHHGFGQTEKVSGDYAEDLAASMLATTLGIDFNPDKAWNDRKQEWKLNKHIVTTRNTTQTAVGEKTGQWVTVVAAAVFCDYNGDSVNGG